MPTNGTQPKRGCQHGQSYASPWQRVGVQFQGLRG